MTDLLDFDPFDGPDDDDGPAEKQWLSADGKLTPLPQMKDGHLLRALARVLPPTCLLHDLEDLRPYECDGLTAYRQLPLAVCLPENEGQVIDVLRACHQLGVPVVARGAGTGLSGGAMPHARGVVLSLARFNRILRVDPLARLAVVQPGVRNLAVSEAAAPFGLYYAPDPSSQIACTIGGNVAENSGGVHCLKYGLTVHNVLAIRGLTSDGEPIEFGSVAPDTPGLDLMALMVGSEGMLAVMLEATVKLVPRPQHQEAAQSFAAPRQQHRVGIAVGVLHVAPVQVAVVAAHGARVRRPAAPSAAGGRSPASDPRSSHRRCGLRRRPPPAGRPPSAACRAPAAGRRRRCCAGC